MEGFSEYFPRVWEDEKVHLAFEERDAENVYEAFRVKKTNLLWAANGPRTWVSILICILSTCHTPLRLQIREL